MNHRSVYLMLGITFSIILAQPTFTEHTISTAADGAESVDAADLDGDGDIDVVSASGVDDKIAWYENDGAQNFTEHVISDTASTVNTIYVADVDGDGDMDVLYSEFYYGIGWYENDGSGNFTRYGISGGSMIRTVYAADVDGDGDMDVLNESMGALYWNENDGSQNFEWRFVSDISSNSGKLYSIYAVDVDGDGDMDLLSASDDLIPGSDDLSWYENDGSESFTKHTITSSSDGNRSVYATDLDGDGDMDVLTACFFADKIAWYENDGSEGFTENVITASADRARSVYAADVDGDGDMDVLSASENNHNIAWYENNGSDNFTEQVISTSAPLARSVHATDVDGDGDMDVLSASSNDDKIAWYEQDGSPVFENTYVPDDNFEQKLIDLGYDDVLDDYVLTENISGVAFLDVNYMEIIDLTGIEDFTALVYLYCRDNQLTSLDISNNTALAYLDLYGNGLTDLDISSNTALVYLNCNDNELTSLDVSNNTVLDDLRIGRNQLASLDVSNNTVLTSLSISGNELTDLDISNNPELMYLGVSSNNNLTSIDLSANTALVNVGLYNTGLTDLDVSNNTALEYLECGYNQLTSLDVSNHTALTILGCSWNQITSLDLSNNTALTHLGIYSNQLTSLDMRNGVTDSLIYFEAMSNPLSCILVNEEDVAWATENWTHENNNIDEGVIFDPECLLAYTYVPDDNFEQALIDLGYDNALDDSVLTANIDIVTELNVSGMEISDLTGIEDFTALENLECGNNQITSLDLSNNPELLVLKCQYNDLSSLNLKGRHPSEYETIEAYENWSLECVDVLDPEWAFYNWEESFDRDVQFEFICGAEDRSEWYVTVDGTDNGGDGSAENPLETIQLAIHIASNGDTVFVAAGTYYENISFNGKDIVVTSLQGAESTFIDGNQEGTVVTFANGEDSTAVLSGFTITNGNGSGVEGYEGRGGGIFCISSSPTLRDLIVTANQTENSGAGLWFGSSNSQLVDLVISNNSVVGYGSPAGGGISMNYDSDLTIDNILVVGNEATFGAGIELWDSSDPTMNNVTLVGNIGGTGGGIFMGAGCHPIINNSIFWDNQPQEMVVGESDTVSVSYSDVSGGQGGIDGDGMVYWGEGNIDEDPIFCEPENGDYSISLVSPLIGAGSEGNSIGDLEIGCGIEPIITEITDVPNDQGNWVYLGFSRCGYDQEGITDQLYTVYRYDTIDDTSAWVGLLSIGAIGEEHYYVEVHTTGDSTAEDSGMGTYKVVASMNEGIYHSDEMSGYSVDNIAPDMPTGMQAMAMENSIILNWDMSEAEDFQYFELERSNDDTEMDDQIIITYELTEITFEDVDLVRNVEYSYRLAAYDDAGNRSEFTGPVSAILLSTDQQSLFPEAYTLHQNYPNPFNPTTQIRYDLPENSYVSINIYDLMGKRVKLLVNSKQDAGYRSIHWNATSDLGQPVSAGMYIYTIQAGEFRKTRKMVVLK